MIDRELVKPIEIMLHNVFDMLIKIELNADDDYSETESSVRPLRTGRLTHQYRDNTLNFYVDAPESDDY